jgi:beta-lactamase class C
MTWRRQAAIAGLTLLFIALFASLRGTMAESEMDRDSQIREIIARDIAPTATTDQPGGLAVAVHVAGETLFFNYGLADQAKKKPVTSDSLFNLGSVRKVFEATLVALGTIRGELKLDDPVSKYVTELRSDYMRRVTIGQLVTHTSGLLLPTDHPPWPNESYSLAEFLDMLNAFTPQGGEAPGKQRIYTHAGYVLLQLALERRYGLPIRKLIEDRILLPLGMTSTLLPERGPDRRAVIGGPREQELAQRLVQGYSDHGMAIGPPGEQQTYFDFPGTGQMFSSARDLSLFLAASLDGKVADPQLREALRMTQHELFRVDKKFGQAMAWETIDVDGVAVVDKPGGLNNASAYMGLVPGRGIGILLLANRGEFPHEIARYRVLPALSRL